MEIIRGKQKRAVLVLLYGPPGIGKSTLASKFGKTIFCDADKNGSDFLEVDRVRVNSFTEVKQFAAEAATLKNEYQTVVFDSLTAIERLAVQDVLKANAWPTIGTPKYGAGYDKVREEFMRIVQGMLYLRSQGMNVIMIGHSKTRTTDEPDLEPYERVEFECQKNLVNTLNGIMDCVFYLRPKIISSEGRTFGTSVRELIMSDKGGAMAKTRFDNFKGTKEFTNESEYTEFWKDLETHV